MKILFSKFTKTNDSAWCINFTDFPRVCIGEWSADVFNTVLADKTGCSVSSRICWIRPTLDQVFSINRSIMRNDHHSLWIAVLVTEMYLRDGRRRISFQIPS